jgi:hypothetical protein
LDMNNIVISDGRRKIDFQGVIASVDGEPIAMDGSDMVSAPAYVLAGVDSGTLTDPEGRDHPLTKGAYVLLRDHGFYRISDPSDS